MNEKKNLKLYVKEVMKMNKKVDDFIKNIYIAFDKYYVRLKKEGKFIFAYIEFLTREEYLKFDKDEYDLIIVKEITSEKKYTFIECQKYGLEEKDGKIKIKYRIDRIYEDEWKNLEDKTINNATISFDDINWFFNSSNSFHFDPIKCSVSVNGMQKEYETHFGKLQIFKGFSFKEQSNEFNITGNFAFNFSFNESINYMELRERMYGFRNLLLILGRRHIDIASIIINDTELIDCFEEYKYNPLNSRYLEYLDHHTITLNEIGNFDKVIDSFYQIYDSIIAIIDSHFCQVKYSLPPKVKFISVCTMIEDFANQFLVEETKKYREIEATKNKTNFIDKSIKKMLEKGIIEEKNKEEIYEIINSEVKKDLNLTFKDKVKAIITNVNDSFKFKEEEIELISDNFRELRKVFVHKGMFADERISQYLNICSSFTEDLIFLNIMKIIGIDISSSIFECIEYDYDRENLIIKIEIQTD